MKEKEKWCEDVQPVVEIGLICSDKNMKEDISSLPYSDEGALRMLLESHYQFDVLDRESEFEKYSLLILPDEVSLDEKFASKLQTYVKQGGKLLLSYRSGFDREAETFLFPQMGVMYVAEGKWCPHFIRIEEKISKDIPEMDYVMYERGNKIEATEKAEVLARVGRPYFNRTWRHFTSHRHSPFERLTDIPEIVKKDNIVYIASPIFRAYKIHGTFVYKKIVQNCLNLIITEKLIYTNLPSTAEVTLNRQESSFILHVLHYIPERRAQELEVIEDNIPLYNIEMRVKTDVEPSRVYLVPQEEKLDFTFKQGYTIYDIPKVEGHQMIVIET